MSQVLREVGQSLSSSFCKAELVPNVSAFNVTPYAQRFRDDQHTHVGGCRVCKNANDWYSSALSTEGTGPHCGCRSGHEIPPSHSITSSARARSVGGIERLSAFAVFRLIINSY